MILYRTITAVPFLIASGLWGIFSAYVFDFPIILGGLFCVAFLAAMIGRTIWKGRHEWNDLDRRGRELGIDIRKWK